MTEVTNEVIRQLLEDECPKALTADGFDDAIIGMVEGGWREAVVCYDYDQCIKILIGRGMELDDAREYLAVNMEADLGEYAPLFLHRWR